MFGAQRERLLRENWSRASGATGLAEELYAMLGDNVPIDLQNPLSLGKVGANPMATLGGLQFGDTLIQVKGRNGQNLGSFVLGENGLEWVPDGGQPATSTRQLAVSGGNVFFGRVKSGTGDTYQVDVFENGRSKPAVTRTVKQVQIDVAKTIPAGQWWTVVKEPDGIYSMQYPVFT